MPPSLPEIQRRILELTDEFKHTSQRTNQQRKRWFDELDRLAEMIAIYRERGIESPQTNELFDMIRPNSKRLNESNSKQHVRMMPRSISPGYWALLQQLIRPKTNPKTESDDMTRFVTMIDQAVPDMKDVARQLLYDCQRKQKLNQIGKEMCQHCVEQALPTFWNHLISILFQQLQYSLQQAMDYQPTLSELEQEDIVAQLDIAQKNIQQCHRLLFDSVTQNKAAPGWWWMQYIDQSILAVAKFMNTITIHCPSH